VLPVVPVMSVDAETAANPWNGELP
jgi:hypothetical protein